MFKQWYCLGPYFSSEQDTDSVPPTNFSFYLVGIHNTLAFYSLFVAVTCIVISFLERKQAGKYSLKANCVLHLLLLSELFFQHVRSGQYPLVMVFLFVFIFWKKHCFYFLTWFTRPHRITIYPSLSETGL